EDAQRAPVDFAEVAGDEPAVDFRIDQTLFGCVAGEERRTAKCEAAVDFAARVEVIEQHIFDGDRRAAFAHSVGGQHGPAAAARRGPPPTPGWRASTAPRA